MRFAVLLLASCSLFFAQEQLANAIRQAQASGDYKRAAQLYKQLIEGGTDAPEIRSNYGVMLHLAGNNGEAVPQLRLALQTRPDLESANFFLGLSLLDEDQFREALPYLERAQKADAERLAPILALGKAYVGLRRYAEANDYFHKAVGLDSTSAEGWYGLGVTNRSRAEELLNRAARNGQAPNTPDAAAIRGYLTAALESLNRAAELEPNSPRTHLLMAQSLDAQGKVPEALAEYQTTLKLNPSLDAARLGLATEYWKNRQFEEATPLLQTVLAKQPKDPEANGILADILQHNGNNGAAKQHALLALAGNGNLIETHVVLARVYLAENQPQTAITELKKAIEADGDGSYHFLLYRAYKQAGDERNAQAALTEFQKRRKGNTAQ